MADQHLLRMYYGREFCRRPDRHPYELFFQLEEVQGDVDAYLEVYNAKRPHRGRKMNGRTPYTVFKAGIPKARKAASATSGKEEEHAAKDLSPAGPSVR